MVERLSQPPAPPGRILSLRLRLTLWVVAIAAIVKISVSLVAQLYQANSIRSLYDDQLQLRAMSIIDSLPRNPSDVTVEDLRRIGQRSSLQAFFSEVRVGIFNLEGEPVVVDPLAAPPDRPAPVLKAAEIGGPAFSSWSAPPAGDPSADPIVHRTLGIPIVAGESAPPGLVLWIATSDQYAEERMIATRRAVVLTTAAGMLGTAIAGWFIAGLAVRPFIQLREAVSRLSATHMSLDSDGTSSHHEVQELREELDKAMHRIEYGYSAYGRFIANVSHELKTPIAVTLSEAEVMLRDPSLGERPRHFAQSIAEEMSRLGRLVESFLTLTRVREGKLHRGVEDYPVNELLMNAVEHCAPYARQMGVPLHPKLVERDPDLLVCVDPDLIRTALDNLIRNAIRFTPAGERVEITAEFNDAAKRVQLCVRDYGPGIPEELLPSLFDRFSQAESEARTGRGAGLGLEIAQGIAEIHNGQISVTNLDRGCMFVLELPPISESEQCEAKDEPRKSNK